MEKEKDENTIQILLQRIIDLTRENEQLRQENEILKTQVEILKAQAKNVAQLEWENKNLEEQLASAYRDNRAYYEQRYGRC